MERRTAIQNSFLAMACLIAAPAVAQTCQSPLPLVNGQTYAANSCSYTNSLPTVGAVVLPHPDVVYRLTSNSGLGGQLSFGASSGNLAALVTSGCTISAGLVAAYALPASGTTVTLPPMPSGDYFLVITGDPTLPATSPVCGSFQFTPQASAPTGTCLTPLAFQSGQTTFGNTCTALNSLPALGPIASPQRQLIYKINRASIAGRMLHFDASSSNLMAAVISSCSSSANLMAAVDLHPAGRTTLDLNALPAGDHYLVVTGDPAGPANACGSFAFTDGGTELINGQQAFADRLRPGYYSQRFAVVPTGATALLREYAGNGYRLRITPQGVNARLLAPIGPQGTPLQALAVSSTSPPRTLRIAFVEKSVTVVGAIFGLTNVSPNFPAGKLTISIRSGSRVTTHSIVGNGQYRGFVSSSPIDEITITGTAITGNPTIDDLIVGTAL